MKKTITVCDNFKTDDCCGCTACMSVCPKNAISMIENNKGFKVPKINKKMCIKCGLCLRVCDFKKRKHDATIKDSNVHFYATRCKTYREVETSRSGAIFIVLADYIIKKNGFVFGCEMVDKNTIVHKWYNDRVGVSRFKGSKYVQSDLKNTFRECEGLLKNDKYVLFSGTRCQLHGLISFLKIKRVDTTKLITLDLICHGAPSPLIWSCFIKRLETKKHKSVSTYNFRDKTTLGWKSHKETVKFDDGTSITIDSWASGFYSHLIFRESCYCCKYASVNGDTDFTIGDCWGIEKINPELDDDKGVSLLIVRSEKGKKIFDEIKQDIDFTETVFDCIKQPNLVSPTRKRRLYGYFWMLFRLNKKIAIDFLFFPNRIVKRITG